VKSSIHVKQHTISLLLEDFQSVVVVKNATIAEIRFFFNADLDSNGFFSQKKSLHKSTHISRKNLKD